MTTEIDYLKEVNLLKPVIAQAADKFIVPRFRSLREEDILNKGRLDETLTIADTDASDFILSWCRERFPGSFTEEEISDDRFDYDILWSIDPLDGTDEFRHGKPGFCVQTSLLVKRGGSYVPVAGIIYLPLEKRFVYGTENTGPFLDFNGKTKKIIARKTSGIIATQREQDPSPELDKFYQFLRKCGYKVKVIDTGGAGSTVAQMFIGMERPNLYIMPRSYTKEWDLSPSENCVSRAGGWISDLHGNQISYNRQNTKNENGYVVAIGLEKEEILARITEFGVNNILNK